MKKYAMRSLAMIVVLAGLGFNTGCNPLIGGLASLASFGAGYWAATRTPQVEVTREYYIDGVKVDDPSALGLE
jgi:hypothetical protein